MYIRNRNMAKMVLLASNWSLVIQFNLLVDVYPVIVRITQPTRMLAVNYSNCRSYMTA